MKRTRVRNMYLERTKDGKFKDWINIGRSINQDKRRTAQKNYKKGYGSTTDKHRGLLGLKFN